MLLPDQVAPENSIYFNASFILKELKQQEEYDLLELYQCVRRMKDMSFSLFILSLDWLFLLEIPVVIRLDRNENVS